MHLLCMHLLDMYLLSMHLLCMCLPHISWIIHVIVMHLLCFCSPFMPQQSIRVLQYWEAGLKVFKPAKVLSIAYDASRVGGNETCLVLAALPSNKAMWSFPQVQG